MSQEFHMLEHDECPDCTSKKIGFRTLKEIAADGLVKAEYKCFDCPWIWIEGED